MFNIFDNAVNHRGFLLHKTVLVNIIIGHATLIGETKKCLGFSVMSKRCRICTNAKKREPPPQENMHAHATGLPLQSPWSQPWPVKCFKT